MSVRDHFTIHEVAKLNNISIDSLRYYERIGLLTPKRGNNKYRYYTFDDLVLLNIIREFHNLNFSFGQIKEMLSGRDLANTKTLLEDELTLVDQEIERLQRTKRTIRQRLDNMNSIFCQVPAGQPCVISLPDMKCLHITNGPMQIDEVDYYISEYLQQTGLDISNIIGRYDLYRLNPEQRVNERECAILEVLVTNNAMKAKPDFILEGGHYLCVTYHGTEFLSGIMTQQLRAYAKEQGLHPVGDYYEFHIFDFYDTSLPEEYLSAVCVKLDIPNTLSESTGGQHDNN